MVETAVSRLGGIDIVVNNDGAPPLGDLSTFDDAAWAKAVEQNLMYVVRMARLSVPHMAKRGGGSILNIAALSALQPVAGFGLSVATWNGVIGFAKTLSLEVAAQNINVNTICPGYIETQRLEKVFSSQGDPADAAQVADGRSPHGPHRYCGGYRTRHGHARVAPRALCHRDDNRGRWRAAASCPLRTRNTPMSADYVWFPDDDIKRNSNWAKFLRASNVGTYEELARRADAEPEWFWDALIRHSGFRFKKPYSQVLDLSEGLPFAKWCIGATTNFTLSCLERNIEEGRGAKTFLVWQGEDGQERTWTYDGLVRETDRIVAALKMLDIGRGDVVGLYMPLMPEAASAVLAVARIGGIIMPLFSGFGADAISTRLNDGDAKAVITVDGCYRRGRRIAMKPIMDEALTKVPSVKSVLVISRFGETPELVRGPRSRISTTS